MKADDLRYGDSCQRCGALSGIDTCPNAEEYCPIARQELPPNYYKTRRSVQPSEQRFLEEELLIARAAGLSSKLEEAFKGALRRALSLQPEKTAPLDAAGVPKREPTLLERAAIEALNEVKAWRDSDGNEGFPHSTREKVEAVLMTYEQRICG